MLKELVISVVSGVIVAMIFSGSVSVWRLPQ